jgi:hypothetical protein
MRDQDLIEQLLQTYENAGVEEIGVFRPPAIDLGRPTTVEGLPEGEEYAAAQEWFSDADLETHFSDDPTITALLPEGLAKRLDIEPRILTFEHLPPPKHVRGPVASAGDGRWVLDTRGEPAVIVLATAHYDLVLWGGSGELRAYALRPVN